MSPDELLPCPFCGGEASGATLDFDGRQGFGVCCVDPDCGGEVMPVAGDMIGFSDKASAITAWNKRWRMS